MNFSKEELGTIKRALVSYKYSLYYNKIYADAVTKKEDIKNIVSMMQKLKYIS